jgi:hypothetical protein
MNVIDLTVSPTAPSKIERSEIKQMMNQAKTYEASSKIFGLREDEVRLLSLEDVLPNLAKMNQMNVGEKSVVEVVV